MTIYSFIALLSILAAPPAHTFSLNRKSPSKLPLTMSTQEDINYNSVYVPKSGGSGVKSASEMMSTNPRSLGAPPPRRPKGGTFKTRGGVTIDATVRPLRYTHGEICDEEEDCYVSEFFEGGDKVWGSDGAIERLIDLLDEKRGAVLTSGYEFPGRYARWSLGFVDPPLEISGKGDTCTITALNARGQVLLQPVIVAMEKLNTEGMLSEMKIEGDVIAIKVAPPAEVGTFSEEERSKQPSLFSVVRSLVDLFGYDSDESGDLQLGLYGAFGYDLTFQFESIKLAQERDPEQRDLLLYLADEIVVVDQSRNSAWTASLDFTYNSQSTKGLPHDGSSIPFKSFDEYPNNAFSSRDTPKGDFTESVARAKHEFKMGNLFEAVLSQTFRQKLDKDSTPSRLFRQLRSKNPSPYGFFFNLGEDEYLVGASPEMFVRCEKVENNEYRPGALRVETCPISGTVARGSDALEDAARVKSLIMNLKEESELTMCTDVDRNDKSRICEPGSVKVIGRRQIEMYSRLIHTVDHVEGYLRPEFDALDAFLCHTWAVTVTGAPKTWAIRFVEENERSPRCWYGGAVGLVGFDGSMNTGLTLRTVRMKNGVAEVRAGATLLYDSDAEAEELETELKASAMLEAIDTITQSVEIDESSPIKTKGQGEGKAIILVDHEDSFVHTLGNYLRQTGAEVTTLRSGPSALKTIESLVDSGKKPDMIVLSPGPGNPTDFELSKTIALLEKYQIPGFGVCLGLQGMVEHFGGELGVLSYPMHGKPSPVTLTEAGKSSDSIFYGLPTQFEVARYHSLHGIRDKLPECLDVTALTEDGIVMGIKHKTLPLAAVQFHPESILTSPAHGMKILQNALSFLSYESAR